MNLKKELELTVTVAVRAGVEIERIYNTGFTVERKSDQSPLTDADKASNKIISSLLKENFPEIPVLSEEGKRLSYKERKGWQKLWIVDPLDGTKEFISRNGEFTVNIALVENGVPVLGAVYAPVFDVLYFGVKGEGSYKAEKVKTAAFKEIMETAEKLVRSERKERDVVKVVASRSHLSPETEAFILGLKQEHPEIQIVSAGSSLKLCLIADGSADYYPRLAPTMEWDTAAGHAVVVFSGGTVYNFHNRQPLTYNKENLLNPWFVADGSAHH